MNYAFVGLTATQKGMTARQKERFQARLQELRVLVLVHGGCVGGDDDGDIIATSLGLYRVIYPSNHPTKALPCQRFRERGGIFIFHEPMPPLQRNPLIIKAVTYLIACPREPVEQVRSGTWTTVRLGRRLLGTSRVEIIEP